MEQNKKIVKRDDNFANWYTSVVQNSQLADYGLIKGTMILKPYGFELWENIKNIIDQMFKSKGVKNCIFPTLIPYSEFIKETNHIEGFAPELFKVNELGNKKLEDPYVLRPTSEIAFCHYFKDNINSYNDLPIKLNQWCNVFRVEKNTRPFLRTSEFFWQEQHSAFATLDQAEEFSKEIMFLYHDLMKDYLAMPVIYGQKTEKEKFAGALKTYTLEGIMQDGQVLQCATSHNLSDNFAKVFNIKYQNKNNAYDYVFQTSAGITTRIIGGIIMVHADDKGLVLPSKISPIQLKINTLFSDKEPRVLEVANKIKNELTTSRIFIDDSNKQLGFKMSSGEIQGIPIQLNIGPKNIANNQVEIAIRNKEEKFLISINQVSQNYVDNLLENYQKELYEVASQRLNSQIDEIDKYDQLENILKNKKVAFVYWSGNSEDEEFIKKNLGATARCLVEVEKQGNCFYTNKKTNIKAYFGRAY